MRSYFAFAEHSKQTNTEKNEHNRINDPDRSINECSTAVIVCSIQWPRLRVRTRNTRFRLTGGSRKKVQSFSFFQRWKESTLTSQPLTSSASSATCVFPLQHSYSQNKKWKGKNVSEQDLRFLSVSLGIWKGKATPINENENEWSIWDVELRFSFSKTKQVTMCLASFFFSL